jgi:hypothetical protein
MAIIEKRLAQKINFDQEFSFYFVPPKVSSSLSGFIADVKTGTATPYGLMDQVSLVKTSNISVVSQLSLSDHAAKALPASATSVLSFSDEAKSVLHEELIDYIYLLSQASGYTTNGLENKLSLVSVAAFSLHRALLLVDNLSIEQNVVVTNFKQPCLKEIFDPTSGEPPILVAQDHIALTYPFVDPSETLTLKNPELNDVDRLDFVRINRKSRGGDLILHRESFWPETEILSYRFSFLAEKKRYEILSFMNSSLGKEIGLLDFEGRQWRGFLMSIQNDIEDSDRGGFDFALEFEGELV